MVANEQGMLLEYLKELAPGSAVPSLFADQLIGLLKIYYLTGGMPEVVARWVQDRDMEDALQWLVGAGMVHKVCRVEKPGIPLSAHSQPQSFKLYLADCGLMRRLARVPASAIMDDSPHYTEFKGALVENYVLNQLVTFLEDLPYYWQSGNTAEVDFIVRLGGLIVPIEVKSATNVRSRSLALYREKFRPELAVRLSLLNVKKQDGLLNAPLYWIGAMVGGASAYPS